MPTSDKQRLELVSKAIDDIIMGQTTSYQMGDGRAATQLDLAKLWEIESMLRERIERQKYGCSRSPSSAARVAEPRPVPSTAAPPPRKRPC